MKKIVLLSIFALLASLTMSAQVPPQKMSYQLVVRDNNNELVVNHTVGIKISILQTSPLGNPVYTETHTVTTNANALATIQVGMGTPNPGSVFSKIPWGSDDFYLKSEIDPAGGTAYSIVGTQQLITVPYAFFSGESAYADSSDFYHLGHRPVGTNAGDILYWEPSDSTWRVLPIGTPGQVLTAQGNGLCWTTNPVLMNNIAPTVITDSVFDVTGRTAQVVCHIPNAGSTGVIASGVCWSTNSNPSLGNSYSTDGTSIDTFISKVTGLVSGTTYYVRAYATNSVGTSYGNPIKFTTPQHCGTVTDKDGNVYSTVYIGAQCWMQENLRTTHYSNGAAITLQHPNTCVSTYPTGSDKFYYHYNDDPSDVAIVGLLYSWGAVMNGAGSSSNNPSGIQGICPSGWHVPSNAEWCELENYVEPGIDVNCNSSGFRGSMAKKLAAPMYWTSYQSNSFAPGYWQHDAADFNTSGFSAIPTGYLQTYEYTGGCHSYNSFSYSDKTNSAFYWSCTNDGGNYVFYRSINYSSSGIELNKRYYPLTTWNAAYSVRCVKN